MLRLILILALGLLTIPHIHSQTTDAVSTGPSSIIPIETSPIPTSSDGTDLSTSGIFSPTLPSDGSTTTIQIATSTLTTTTTNTTGNETATPTSELPLILGISLGVGIPVLIGIIAGLVYYFKVYKPRQQKVAPNQDPTISNTTTAAITNIPLAPMKTTTKKQTITAVVV